MNDSKSGLHIRFFNTDIEYSANQCLYYRAQHQFESYAQKVVKDYEAVYKTYQDYKTFSEKGIEDGVKLAEHYIGQGMKILLDSGIYNISQSEFENQCSWEIHQSWHEVFRLQYELGKASGTTIKEAEDLREVRKASRSRPISVGFGLSGTVGSYAASSGINAISGLLHSGANAIGNARTRSAVREKLNEIYQSPDLLDAVKKCAYDGVMAIWGVTQFHLSLEDEEWKRVTIPEEDQQRARAYCENFVHIPDDKRNEFAVEILKYGIADIHTYEVLVQAYQDQDGVLLQAASAFGLEEEYRSILKEKISNTIQPSITKYTDFLSKITLSKLSKVTDDIYAEVRYTLTETCKLYHIDASDPIFSYCWRKIESAIQKKVNQLYEADKEARTFKGILFPTVEDAALAKSIGERVVEINSNFEGKPSSEQNKLLLEIEQLNSQAPAQLKASIDQIYEKLNGIYENTERQERTFLDTIFPTRDARIAAEAQYNSLMSQWFPAKSAVTPDSMQAAREAVENQQDLADPVRQAILNRITVQEKQFAQEIRQQQEENAHRSTETKLIVWNLLYGAIVLWAMLFWKIFRFDGVDSSAIGLLQLFYNNTDTITAARGFLAVGTIVIVVQTLSNMKKALKRDLNDVLSYPGTILVLCLFVWGLTAFLHLSYDITSSYIILLVVSLFFQLINSSEGKGVLKKLGIVVFCGILLWLGITFFGKSEPEPIDGNATDYAENISSSSAAQTKTAAYLAGERCANNVLGDILNSENGTHFGVGILYNVVGVADEVDGLRDATETLGVNVSAVETYTDSNATDFNVQLSSFQTTGTNLIFLVEPDTNKSSELGIQLLVQANALGFYPSVYDLNWGYVDIPQEESANNTLSDFAALEGTYHMAHNYTLQMGLWFESDMTGINSSNWQGSEPLELHFQLNDSNEILGDGVAYWWPLSEGLPYFEGELYSSLEPITIEYDGSNFIVSCSALGIQEASFFKD